MKHPGPTGSNNFVTGEYVEVRTDLIHTHALVGNRLRAIDQRRDPAVASESDKLGDRIDRAECI